MGHWTNNGMRCPNVCMNGMCGGVCSPGSQQCAADQRTPQTCSAQGQWVSAPACMFVCMNGVCAGECVPGSMQCNVDVPQKCDPNGHWVSGSPCPNGCMGMGVCNPPPDDAGSE